MSFASQIHCLHGGERPSELRYSRINQYRRWISTRNRKLCSRSIRANSRFLGASKSICGEICIHAQPISGLSETRLENAAYACILCVIGWTLQGTLGTVFHSSFGEAAALQGNGESGQHPSVQSERCRGTSAESHLAVFWKRLNAVAVLRGRKIEKLATKAAKPDCMNTCDQPLTGLSTSGIPTLIPPESTQDRCIVGLCNAPSYLQYDEPPAHVADTLSESRHRLCSIRRYSQHQLLTTKI